MPTPIPAPDSPAPRPKRFYQSLWVQVTVAIALAIVFGYLSPKHAVAMKPLGDAFIRLITMLITVMIFCTVVTGIAGMRDLRKVGRVGGKGPSLLRNYLDARFSRRIDRWKCRTAREWFQCRCGYARCASRRGLCRAGQNTDGHRFLDAHYSDDNRGRLCEGRHT